MKQIKSLLLLTLLAWHMSYLQAEPSNQAEWDQAQAPDFIVQQQSDTDQQKNIVSTLYEKDYDTWQGITNLKKITTYDDGNITTELKTSVPTMLSWKNLAYGVGAAGALGLGAASAYYALSPSQNSAEPVVPVVEPNPAIIPTPVVAPVATPILPVAAPIFVDESIQNRNNNEDLLAQPTPVIPAAILPTDNTHIAPVTINQPEQSGSSWWPTVAGVAATGAAALGMSWMGQPERERRNDAATKIQARARGYQSRQRGVDIDSDRASVGDNLDYQNDFESGIYPHLQNATATPIQAHERGRQSRTQFNQRPMYRNIPEQSMPDLENMPSQVLVPYAQRDVDRSSNYAIPQPSAADYSTLGLQPGAQITVNDVNRAFRRAAPTYHSDKGGDQQQWQQLQNARDTLIAWIEQNNQSSNNGQPLQITWPDTADQNTSGQRPVFGPKQSNVQNQHAITNIPATPHLFKQITKEEEAREQALKLAQENDDLSPLSEDDFDTIDDATSEDFNTQSSISEDDFENVPSQDYDSDSFPDITSIYPSSNDNFEYQHPDARLTPQQGQKSEFERNVTSTDSAAPSNKLNKFSRQQLTQIINYEADEIKQAQKQNNNRSNTTNSKTSSSLRTPTPPKDEKRSTESPIQKKRIVNKISQESLINLQQMLQKKQREQATSAGTTSSTTTPKKMKWQLPTPRTPQDQRSPKEIAQEEDILKKAF